MVSEILSFSNPLFAGYTFYATIVLIKMFALGFLTSIQRGRKNAFANPEDAETFGSKHYKDKSVTFSDSDVERVRRNHLNDLENIPAFIFLGYLYIFTGPSLGVALWHFRIFVIARFLHTVAYQLPLPQPSRALFHIVGLFACLSMAFQIIQKTA